MKENIKLFYTDLEADSSSTQSKIVTNMIYCICVGVLLFLLCFINIKSSKMMAVSTGIGGVICIGGGLTCAIMKRNKLSSACVSISLAILFTIWTIKGGNNGFAVIWLAIAPALAILAHGLRHGTYLSVYFGVMLYVLFYTPLRSQLQYDYNDIFLQRFPIVYTVAFISSFCGFFYMHKTALKNEAQRKELEELKIKADEANRAKSTFLATMSHEIRTPINGILGMNSIMLNECKDESLKEYAFNVQSAGNTLLSLINDILDISKIESGKMEIVPTNYRLFSVLNDCYNMTLPRTKDKGIDFVMDIDENLPTELYGDEIRIRQIFNNILSNAAKYTNEGEIKFSLTFETNRIDSFVLKAIISDTGIGIREEDKKKLFDSFTRLDENRNRNVEGTGLGLHLTKSLVDMMDGDISVESLYGKGSVFIVTIPQQVINREPIGDFISKYRQETLKFNDEEDDLFAPAARLLVVDDVYMNLLVVKGLLKNTGMLIDTAKSGVEAIDKMSSKEYEIVFLDHMMPEMDGIETLKRFKNLESELNKNTPIIMLTANAITGAKEEYLQGGFNDYISKPVTRNDLKEMIIKYLPDGMIVKR